MPSVSWQQRRHCRPGRSPPLLRKATLNQSTSSDDPRITGILGECTAFMEKSRRRRAGLDLPELPELLAMTNRFDTKCRNEDETHHCANDGAVRLS